MISLDSLPGYPSRFEQGRMLLKLTKPERTITPSRCSTLSISSIGAVVGRVTTEGVALTMLVVGGWWL